jgi:hypothetical protein
MVQGMSPKGQWQTLRMARAGIVVALVKRNQTHYRREPYE